LNIHIGKKKSKSEWLLETKWEIDRVLAEREGRAEK